MADALIQDRLAQREQTDRTFLLELREKARFAMLPSPEALESAYKFGQDSTDTIGDCAKVLQWVTEAELFNTGFYKEARETAEAKKQLERGVYRALILFTFNSAFAPIRHTGSPEAQELVFWYYAGHGLDSGRAGKLKQKFPHVPTAVPVLQRLRFDARDHFSSAQEFLPDLRSREVKGGELCLHDIGFCGLYGLLEAWIAALKTPSQNDRSSQTKTNKHLVVVLDSCYSGQFADDLRELAKRSGPWNENNCTVTIQASCSANETADGGYFTPCFTHLSQHKDALEKLEQEWNGMDDAAKETYRSLQLQSPEVATTHSNSNAGPVFRIQSQNFEMVLFPDAGFFKYCSVMLFKEEEEAFLVRNERRLTGYSVSEFLNQASFTILDYKLKKISSHDPAYANTPMGLFLVETQPGDPHVVCVHIHFARNDTSRIQRINLVHHLRPTHSSILYVEESRPTKIQVNIVQAQMLVQACRDEVENNEPGRWGDASRWNMTSSQLGVKALFRVKQRSAEMDGYVNYYFPEATNASSPWTSFT